MEYKHKSVLLKEAIEYLNIKKGGYYIDATLGLGGHTLEILKKGGKVLGIDQDYEVLEETRRRLAKACPDAFLRLVWGNFSNIDEIVKKERLLQVDGIIFDLGVGNYQFEDKERGFSFDSDAVLDMRMDKSLKVKAVDLINGLSKGELYELFNKIGEEEYALAIAKAIVNTRLLDPIKTGKQLAHLITRIKGEKRGGVHPATKVFMALRICVNDELNSLKIALPKAVELLKNNGKLIVISFHSGEDRIVKQFFNSNIKLTILTEKPISASDFEITDNPKARSAKLRAAEKI